MSKLKKNWKLSWKENHRTIILNASYKIKLYLSVKLSLNLYLHRNTRNFFIYFLKN